MMVLPSEVKVVRMAPAAPMTPLAVRAEVAARAEPEAEPLAAKKGQQGARGFRG